MKHLTAPQESAIYFAPAAPTALGSIPLMEGAMRSPEIWSKSVPTVELDQRSREARIRFESMGGCLFPLLECVKRQAIGTPDRHGKGTPHRRWGRLVPVANRRVPRASRSASRATERRAWGACLPTGASRGGTQARCLKRQLSLPVSMISQ